MDEVTVEEETVTEEYVEKRRRGPGFLLGIGLGTLAGAAAATLFSPMSGEEVPHEAAETAGRLGETEGVAGAPADRLRGALARFRGRLSEARQEGRQAAEEAETSLRARFNELTQ